MGASNNAQPTPKIELAYKTLIHPSSFPFWFQTMKWWFPKKELPPIHPNISWRSENTLPILGEINTVACPDSQWSTCSNTQARSPEWKPPHLFVPLLCSKPIVPGFVAPAPGANWTNCELGEIWSQLMTGWGRRMVKIYKKKINDAESDLIYPYNFIDFMITHRTPTIKSRQNLYSLQS